ncbi:MAG: agmatine deiminase family protein [Candidatus Melainabacteria bacterium]|nr:agmatine deiminase family protein [Candidatus Melainabacteria bacterium]
MGYLTKKESGIRIQESDSKLYVRRCPGEWERQSAVWLAWPHNEKEWKSKLPEIKEFYVKLINLILQFQDVKLVLHNEELLNEVVELEASVRKPEAKRQCHKIVIPNNDIWIRDYGPFFLQVIASEQSERSNPDRDCFVAKAPRNDKLIANFEFNAWGGKFPPFDFDNQVPKNIALYLGEICESYPIILEGGAIDFNGNGIAVTTEECLLNKNRNPNLDKEQFENILKSVFNLQKIIWLECGLKNDHTDGHVDNVARFINGGKLLINEPVTKELKVIEKIIAKYELEACELPFPDVDRKKMPSASYLNFIFVNEGIIVPIFNSTTDKIAIDTFQKIFPKRKILGLDCSLLIQEGGGLHCISKQESYP